MKKKKRGLGSMLAAEKKKKWVEGLGRRRRREIVEDEGMIH